MTCLRSVVKSETGSGKTLCYLIPILHQLASKGGIRRDNGVYCLILSPTRELAIQIEASFKKLTKYIPFIIGGCLLGGEDPHKEK